MNNNSNNMMRYAGLATQWMAMLLVAVWIGYKLDKLTHWSVPVFLILLPLVSLIVSLWGIIKESSKNKE